MRKRAAYDALVVGSGLTGSWAAKELCEQGMSVLLLEAGPERGPGAPASSAAHDAESYKKRQPIQSQSPTCDERNHMFYVDDMDHPYTTPRGKPFSWIRGRQVLGRLHQWGRLSLRMSDHELKAASRDGFGEDWPISYADLGPYYDKVEKFWKVTGAAENLAQVPDGVFRPPAPMPAELLALKRRVEQRWRHRRVMSPRVCTAAPSATLGAAARTGRLSLRSDAIVSQILIDVDTAKAKGVAFVDRITKRSEEVFGRVVILCASTIESTRLLLHSATRQHEGGLGNSSGTLGHYLMDHVYLKGAGRRPGATPQKPVSPRLRLSYPSGFLLPSFRNVERSHPAFLRGYCVYGVSSVEKGVRHHQLWAHGEMLPRFENTIALSPSKKDAWGLPVVRIECAHSENELKMGADIQAVFRDLGRMLELESMQVSARPLTPGLAIHELGTARMGHNPRTSVLNSFNQCWDVPNLFVTDGACFPSSPWQNPSLTMAAITARACRYIVEQSRRGAL